MVALIGGAIVPVLLDSCPVCHETMVIRELYCPNCDVTVRGEFHPGTPGPFARLNDEQIAFLHLFVTSRGNMSDVERSLGVSYPTVRAKLDDLIAALTTAPAPPKPPAVMPVAQVPPTPAQPEVPPVPAAPPASATPAAPAPAPALTRREILAGIADGSLSVEEGMNLMRRLPEE
jgi:hypothetical protein